ncbi:ABC transporter permease [Streptomyces sp. N2-109]|uniref:ABC transporter permease n=1 Tax=Streptomyces gossypii TaxID=2883101 RepID=A0ABT2JY26_9ACTN|nr:FtsX-like permease family protein [Streptomyces gossypii]MCT2592741.1 ABC transporter permease [Streptomyces gossypii]
MNRVMLTKTRRDLRRRLPQFAAVAMTVMVGVLLFVASYDAYRNLSDSYERTYSRLHFADLSATGGDPAKVAAAVEEAPGVADVTTRTQADLPMRIGGDKLVGRVVGLPGEGRPEVNRVEVTEGTGLTDGTGIAEGDSRDPADGSGVLIERHAADTFGLSPGDTMQVFDGSGWQPVTVRGVVTSAEYLWPARSRQEVLGDPHSFAVVFATGATARQLAGPDGGGQTLVRLADGAGDGTAAEVTAKLREAGAVDVVRRADQPSHSVLIEDLKGFEQLALGFPVLFLSAAAIAAYVLITRLVLAERKVIATFLAAGAPRGAVVRHYLGHGALAGGAGAVLGVALGTVATSAVTRVYTDQLHIPDTVVGHRPAVALTGLLFGLLVGLAGGLAPALAASRAAPAEAMRGDVGALPSPGRWSRALARARRLPVTVRMALRELTRSRRRTLATMTGTVLALVLVLASVGMITSMTALVDTQFGQVQRQDATVTADPHARDLEQRLRAVPEVAEVERVTEVPATVTAAGASYATSLSGFRTDTRMHGFRTEDGGSRTLPDDGVLAGQALTDRLDVAVGDSLTVHTHGGEKREVRLAGLVDEPLGTALYGSRGTVREMTGLDGNTYQLRLEGAADTEDREAVRSAVTGLEGVVAYTDEQALRGQLDAFLGLFWVFAGVMLVLGGALALTVIYVTMTVNVAERGAELATLRAAGVPLRRIAGMLAMENLTATLLAVPLGLALGALTAYESLRAFDTDMFTLDLSLGWPVLTAATLAVLAASLLSQIPAVRMVRRLDVARVVRERAG